MISPSKVTPSIGNRKSSPSSSSTGWAYSVMGWTVPAATCIGSWFE